MRQFQRDFPPVFSDREIPRPVRPAYYTGYGYARGVSVTERIRDAPRREYRIRTDRNFIQSNFKMSKLRNGRYLTLCTHEFRDPLLEHAWVIVTFMIVSKENYSSFVKGLEIIVRV